MTIKDMINTRLKLINGKRRSRLLEQSDIFRIISEALQDGQSTTGGGTVANAYWKSCYGPAYQTVACSLKKNKQIFVKISVKSARKGTSQVPDEIGLSITGLKNWDGSNADITMNTGQARRLVRNWRINRGEVLSLPKVLQGIPINVTDSLAVGNCETYTSKVASEIGKQTGTSDELFRFIKQKYPDQMARALRCIKYAASKLKPVGV